MCAIVWRDGRLQLVYNALASEKATGIADLEGLCVKVVNDYLAVRRIYLSDEDRQDMIGSLMGVAWAEASRYDRKRGSAISASRGQQNDMRGYLITRLRWRATDWMRVRFGDDRRRPKVQVVQLQDVEAEPVLEQDDTVNLTRALGFDPGQMAPDALWTLERVALPLARGRTLGEIAVAERKSKADLELALEALRLACVDACALASNLPAAS